MEVKLCEGLKKIECGAFAYCNIKSIKIPSTVKDISQLAFSDCKQLIEVKLCEGLKKIEFGPFSR